MISRILRLLLERRLFSLGRRTGALVLSNDPAKAFDENPTEDNSDDPWLAACARSAISPVHDGANT